MPDQSNWHGIVAVQAIVRPDTSAMFREDATVSATSPIDVFISNTNLINTLYLGSAGSGGLPPELGSLVLLGYMSAVESYFRALLRGCIRIDAGAQKAVELMPVPYGAALHHERELLPEALFEGVSFAGKKGAIEFVRSVLGLKGNVPSEVETSLSSFLSICEIRHCCVHRFGKLGSQNAIKLGLDEHARLIEKPFEPTTGNLQDVADILRTFVKSINNWLWSELLKRTVRRSPSDSGTIPWTWRWTDDSEKFSPYFELFASSQDSPASRSVEEMYAAFAGDVGPRGAPFAAADDDE